MHADLQIDPIGSDSRFVVAAQRYEVMFKDDSQVGLHRVFQNGAPVLLLRALRFSESLVVFRIEDVHRALAEDLPATPTRDIPGLIFYSLRSRFDTADELIKAVMQHSLCIIPATDAGPQQTLFAEAA